MYKITAIQPGGSQIVIYDPSTGPRLVQNPKQTEELNQPGSLEFTLLYGHEAFEELGEMQTYIVAQEGTREIFYGRVLSIEPTVLLGQETITCEGALSFLNDGHLHPDPKNSSGSYQHQTMTAEAFFRRCIAAYNADIGTDARRNLTVGTVSHSRSTEERTYQITNFNTVKEALEQNLIGIFGGYLRIRPDGSGGHLIDWVETYGLEDNSTLELGENIISQENRMSGENMFTAIRPVGKEGLVHSTTPILDVYPAADMAKYGRIIKNVDFPNITTEAALLAAGQELLERIHKTVYISSDISLLSLHFVDGTIPDINLGDSFTNIAKLEGITLIANSRSRDYENPQNDSVSLQNEKHLEGDGLDDYRNDEGSLSKRSSRSSGGVGMALKYYHELQDEARIVANRVAINAQNIEIAADTLLEQANELIQLSTTTGDLGNRVSGMEGTGVIQNSELITEVAGKFRVETLPGESTAHVKLIEGATLSVEKNGIYSEVIGDDELNSAILQTASSLRIEFGQKATVYYQYSDPASAVGNTVQNKDLWIKSNKIDSYDEAEPFSYEDLGQYDWMEYYGAIIYVRENGVWKETTNNQRAEMLFAENEFTLEKVNLIRGDLDSLGSQFIIEKEAIRSIVVNTRDELRSSITQESDRISLVVEGTGSNAHIKPAQIVAAINAQTGTSKILLSADIIDMDGDIIADRLDGNVITLEELSAEDAFFEDAEVSSNLHFMTGATISYGFGGGFWDVEDVIVAASVSGNTLTLYPLHGNAINFSKPSTTPTISNSSTDIYTSSSWPSGATDLSRLVSQFNKAKSDGDNLIFRVHVGNTVKLFGCTP